MDDREIRSVMGSLRPRKSPAGLDSRILSEAESAARRARSSRRRRVGLGLFAAAAAAVLLGVVGWRLGGTGDSSRGGRAESDAASAMVATQPIGEPLTTAASAKATLLELRIERLRRIARASAEPEETLSKLDSLRRELETIEEVYIDTVPASCAVEPELVGSEEETSDEKQTRLEPGDRGGDPRRIGAHGV